MISGASATVAPDVPQQILLRPASREYGLHREQYEAVAADLEREGVLVRVLPVTAIPKNDAENAAELCDLAIQVGAFAGTIVSNAKLVEIVLGPRPLRDAARHRDNPVIRGPSPRLKPAPQAVIHRRRGRPCDVNARRHPRWKLARAPCGLSVYASIVLAFTYSEHGRLPQSPRRAQAGA